MAGMTKLIIKGNAKYHGITGNNRNSRIMNVKKPVNMPVHLAHKCIELLILIVLE